MLAGAAWRHDAAPCAHAGACERCTAARARGEVCALPGCGLRHTALARRGRHAHGARLLQ
jgi:hypothetical protein